MPKLIGTLLYCLFWWIWEPGRWYVRESRSSIRQGGDLNAVKSLTPKVRQQVAQECWSHLRHLTSVLLTYTQLYFVVVAGVLAFLAQASTANPRPLWVVLAVISALGFAMCFRSSGYVRVQREALEMIADAEGVPTTLRTFRGPSGIAGQLELRKYLFPAMYFLATGFFAYLCSNPDFLS
jgi:hypothetical protein